MSPPPAFIWKCCLTQLLQIRTTRIRILSLVVIMWSLSNISIEKIQRNIHDKCANITLRWHPRADGVHVPCGPPAFVSHFKKPSFYPLTFSSCFIFSTLQFFSTKLSMSGPLTEHGAWIRTAFTVRKKNEWGRASWNSKNIRYPSPASFLNPERLRQKDRQMNCTDIHFPTIGSSSNAFRALAVPPRIYISMAADGVAMGGGSAIWQMMGNGQRWRAFPDFSMQTNLAVPL